MGKKTWAPGKNLKTFGLEFGISLREQIQVIESICEAMLDFSAITHSIE